MERVAKKGIKKVHGQLSGDKSQITLVACGNVAGTVLPPIFIFKGERLNRPKYTLWDVQEWLDQPRTFLLLVKGFVFEVHPSRAPRHARNGWPLLPLHT